MGNENSRQKSMNSVTQQTHTVVLQTRTVTVPRKTCPTCGKTNHNFNACKYQTSLCKICKKPGHLEQNCFHAMQVAVLKTTKESVKEAKKCYVCGGTNHDFNKCKYQMAKCRICGRVGHGEMACNENPLVQKMVQTEVNKQLLEKQNKTVAAVKKEHKLCWYCGKPDHDFKICKNKAASSKLGGKPGHEESARGKTTQKQLGGQKVKTEQTVKVVKTKTVYHRKMVD